MFPLRQIEFGDPNEAELREFLCTEKQFGEMRVNAGLEKLKESKVKKVQSTLESFFGKPTKVINNLKGAKDKDKGKLAGSSKRK